MTPRRDELERKLHNLEHLRLGVATALGVELYFLFAHLMGWA